MKSMTVVYLYIIYLLPQPSELYRDSNKQKKITSHYTDIWMFNIQSSNHLDTGMQQGEIITLRRKGAEKYCPILYYKFNTNK